MQRYLNAAVILELGRKHNTRVCLLDVYIESIEAMFASMALSVSVEVSCCYFFRKYIVQTGRDYRYGKLDKKQEWCHLKGIQNATLCKETIA